MVSTHAREAANLLNMQMYAQAAETLRKGLKADPKDLHCLLGLSRTLLAMGEKAEAEATLRKLVELAPDLANARSMLALLRAQAGDATGEQELEALGTWEEAGYTEVYNWASFLLEYRKDAERAQAVLERAARIDPDSPYVFFDLGRIALARADYGAAVVNFTKAAKLQSSEPMPLVMLSRAHAARGEVAIALDRAQQAQALAPKLPVVLEDLYKLNMLAGSPQTAVHMATELRVLDGKNPNYAYMHAVALLSLGQLNEARSILETVVQQAPEATDAWRALAHVHDVLEDEAGARRALEQALKIAPTEIGPANDMATLLFQKDGHAQARTLLEPVLKAHPEDPVTHLNYAIAVMKSDKSTALSHARKAASSSDLAIREQAERLVQKLS